MENTTKKLSVDNRQRTEELLEQSGKLREQTHVTNDKLADIKKRTDEILQPKEKTEI